MKLTKLLQKYIHRYADDDSDAIDFQASDTGHEGGGAAEQEPITPPTRTETSPPTRGGTPPAAGRTTPATVEKPPTTSADPGVQAALAELGKGLSKLTQFQTQQVEKEKATAAKMTPEQEAEYWGIFNPTAKNQNFFKELLNLPDDVDPKVLERATARLQEFMQGITRQSVIGARNLFQMELAKLRSHYDERLEPVTKYMTESNAREMQTRFYGDYPGLKDPRFAKIVTAISATFAGKTFPGGEAEYFKALAESAADQIKGLLPDFDLKKDNTKSATTTPRLPRSRAGGTGGAGSNASPQSVKAGVGDDADTAIDWNA